MRAGDYFNKKLTAEFSRRFNDRIDELKWLYMELYHDSEESFRQLCNLIYDSYNERNKELKRIDRNKEKNPGWYLDNQLVGMMLYTENFADNLQGVKKHLDYLKEVGINYVHLMPLLDTTDGKSDGGYAVSNYRKVKESLGTMEDLSNLTATCHKEDMCVCLDFVMNHTSEDHEWARRALNGEREYQDMYFLYDNYDIPQEFERTIPEVFPQTAPGNFTYLPSLGKFVMTSFYPYQWDLNYWNPRVFYEMVGNLLFLANQGIDILRIDAVPYIWKQLGTNCRNLPQVHTIVRMCRLIAEIVAPSVILLGEVVMEPKELAPYFGSENSPECHILYNATTMCTLWHTVATRDTRLLRYQTDQVVSLPKTYGFINYIRCHDDIGWGLDYKFLKQQGMEEVAHKRFLNDYFRGYTWNSKSRGELYNEDFATGDARFCGMAASMCGIELGISQENEDLISQGIDLDAMLHAFIMFQSGIPVIYSGDEIGVMNDYAYHDDPLKSDDSRYIHRVKMDWKKASKIKNKKSIEGRLFAKISQLEEARRTEEIFCSDANVYTIETHNQAVLGMIRIKGDSKIVGLFNFSDVEQEIDIVEFERDNFVDYFDKKKRSCVNKMVIRPYEYIWAISSN